MLGVYAELDARVNASQADAPGSSGSRRPDPRASSVYPGVDHAFFNDTGSRYNEAQATQAYQDMLAWFGQHLA